MAGFVQTSRFLSHVLHHDPAVVGMELDEQGWANAEELAGASDKQRFSFLQDGTKIRANQDHSISVDVELTQTNPPAVLYHGTAERFLPRQKGHMERDCTCTFQRKNRRRAAWVRGTEGLSC